MNPKVSVIVIVYNAVGLIPRCIDSILAQSFRDFELIVVDDGSTDGTDAVIDRYALSDGRIKPLHQRNMGVAAARQAGLDLASGDYSIFVDADDWIEPDMLESMYDRAVDDCAGMVFCDYVEENGLGTFYRRQQPTSSDSAKVLEQMLVSLHGGMVNKLIDNDLYKRSGFRFIPGLNYCEDECMIIRLLSLGCRVSYVGKAFYHYDKNSNAGSISNLWAYRPVEEYDLFIKSCSPYLDTPELQKNLNERIAATIKKLTYAPADKYGECQAFYRRHKAALMKSRLSLPKKLFCMLYFNGFRFLAGLRESYHNKH